MGFNPDPYLTSLSQLKISGESEHGDAAGSTMYFQSFPVDLSGLQPDSLRREHMREHDFEVSRIVGRFGGSITTKHYLHGHSSSLPTAYSATAAGTGSATIYDNILAIFASAIGQHNGGSYAYGSAYTTGTTGSPVSAITDTTQDLTDFPVGESLTYATGDDSLPYYTAWGTNSQADSYTLLQDDPPFSPESSAGSEKLWGGITIWQPSTSAIDAYHAQSNAAASWTLEVLGHNTDHKVTLSGCRPIGLKFDLPIGGLPTYEITWGVADWEQTGSGGAPSVATYSYPAPEPCLAWYCAFGDSATNSLQLKNLSIDIGITRNQIADGRQASGVGGWFTHTRRPQISFTVHRNPGPSSGGEVDLFLNQTSKPFTFQHGTQPGKMFGVCVPAAVVTEYPQPTDDAGAIMSQVVIEPTYYSADDGDPSSTTAVDSAFRISLT